MFFFSSPFYQTNFNILYLPFRNETKRIKSNLNILSLYKIIAYADGKILQRAIKIKSCRFNKFRVSRIGANSILIFQNIFNFDCSSFPFLDLLNTYLAHIFVFILLLLELAVLYFGIIQKQNKKQLTIWWIYYRCIVLAKLCQQKETLCTY